MTAWKILTALVIGLVLAAGSASTVASGSIACIGSQGSDDGMTDAGTAKDRPFPLMIGDKPPPLTVGEWLRGDSVGQFEPGHIYVINFWATWCAPCMQAVPHIAALQDQYRDQVTIIGVNVLEYIPVRVPPVLLKLEETITYSIAMDDVPENRQAIEGKMAQSWLYASGHEDIPLSFIIDRQSRIAWIGYSLDMIDPLAAIVDGTWDIETFAGEYQQIMRWVAAAAPVKKELESAIELKEWQKSLAACRKLLEIDKTEFVEDAAIDLNRIAALIVSSPSPSEQDLDVALEAARLANELTGWRRIFTISTMASVHFKRGSIDRAIELLEKAIELGDEGEKRHLNNTLEQYKAAQESRK